jgi:hypothetical protein
MIYISFYSLTGCSITVTMVFSEVKITKGGNRLKKVDGDDSEKEDHGSKQDDPFEKLIMKKNNHRDDFV